VVGGVIVRGPSAVAAVAILFVLLVPLEKIWRRHPYRVRLPGLATDIGYLLATPVLGAVGLMAGLVIAVVSLAWIPGLLLRPVVTAQPGWVKAVEAVLLFDLVGYWAHRAAHQIPMLWRFHAVHHSSERLDWIAGVRAHPLDGVLVAAVPAVGLIAAGSTRPRLEGCSSWCGW
jgi:sterol desaturase/sphingolipid hydroxylase (fatty acid hydroxylase superfamily)